MDYIDFFVVSDCITVTTVTMKNNITSNLNNTTAFCNITGNDTNLTCPTTPEIQQQAGRNELLAKFEIAVLSIILFFALFGNLVVIIVLLYRKRKLSRMQLFIIHLACADILVGLWQVLPQLIMDITYRFDGNNFLCKLTKYLQVGTMYGSTYVLIMTALDRYMSICHPLTSQTWTTRRVHVMVLIAWALSGLFSIPQLIIFSYKERAGTDGVYYCLDNFDIVNALWELQAYITWICVSVYFVPFIILTVCYTRICYVVWVSVNSKESTMKTKKKYKSWSIYKHDKIEKENEACLNGSPKNIRNPRAHTKRLSKSKIKTVKMTLTVIICFLVCWAPFFITQMWSAYDIDAPYFTSK